MEAHLLKSVIGSHPEMHRFAWKKEASVKIFKDVTMRWLNMDPETIKAKWHLTWAWGHISNSLRTIAFLSEECNVWDVSLPHTSVSFITCFCGARIKEKGSALTNERVSRVIFSWDHPEVVFTCPALGVEEQRREKYMVKGARMRVHKVALHSESNRQKQAAEQAKEPGMHVYLQDSRTAVRHGALDQSVQYRVEGQRFRKEKSRASRM